MPLSEVILYVVPGCPLCREVREFLREHDVAFVERDVANDYSALRRMYKLTRQGLVPVVETNGRTVVRPDDAQLGALLGL